MFADDSSARRGPILAREFAAGVRARARGCGGCKSPPDGSYPPMHRRPASAQAIACVPIEYSHLHPCASPARKLLYQYRWRSTRAPKITSQRPQMRYELQYQFRRGFSVMLVCACALLATVSAAKDGVVEVNGVVQATPASGLIGDWKIAARQVRTDASTIIKQQLGAPIVGAIVEVKGAGQPDGSVLATSLEVTQAGRRIGRRRDPSGEYGRGQRPRGGASGDWTCRNLARRRQKHRRAGGHADRHRTRRRRGRHACRGAWHGECGRFGHGGRHRSAGRRHSHATSFRWRPGGARHDRCTARCRPSWSLDRQWRHHHGHCSHHSECRARSICSWRHRRDSRDRHRQRRAGRKPDRVARRDRSPRPRGTLLGEDRGAPRSRTDRNLERGREECGRDCGHGNSSRQRAGRGRRDRRGFGFCTA